MLILVVEDESLIALAIEWGLKIAGHRVLGPAADVDGAIRLCRLRRPDFALIDLNLRDGGDGVDVARFLHEQYQTPCLFLSAQAAHARAHRSLAIGLIRKPYDFAALPAFTGYVVKLVQGHKPGNPPAGLELFLPSDP